MRRIRAVLATLAVAGGASLVALPAPVSHAAPFAWTAPTELIPGQVVPVSAGAGACPVENPATPPIVEIGVQVGAQTQFWTFPANPDGSWSDNTQALATFSAQAPVTADLTATCYGPSFPADQTVLETGLARTANLHGTPSAPIDVHAFAGSGRVQLQWSPPAFDGDETISDYVVQYSVAPFTSWSTVDDGTSATPGATVEPLSNGTSYEFRVAAVNSLGTGPFASPVEQPIRPRSGADGAVPVISGVPAAPVVPVTFTVSITGCVGATRALVNAGRNNGASVLSYVGNDDVPVPIDDAGAGSIAMADVVAPDTGTPGSYDVTATCQYPTFIGQSGPTARTSTAHTDIRSPVAVPAATVAAVGQSIEVVTFEPGPGGHMFLETQPIAVTRYPSRTYIGDLAINSGFVLGVDDLDTPALPPGSYTYVFSQGSEHAVLPFTVVPEPVEPPIRSLSVPQRLLDTRAGGSTGDGDYAGVGRISADSTLALAVAGRVGVPVSASSVVLNVTAVVPSADGFLTVFPCGQERPNTSNVNFSRGGVVPNSVIAKVGASGRVCIYSSAQTDVLVDVSASFGSADVLVPLASPRRVLDTRSGGQTADGAFAGVGRVGADATLELPVAGRVGVPGGASSVVLNVTAVVPSADGFLTVFPCGQERPNTSNVNFSRGGVVPNSVIAKVGASGRVCIYSSAQTDVLVDVSASFAA